jgi:hypothetical protein
MPFLKMIGQERAEAPGGVWGGDEYRPADSVPVVGGRRRLCGSAECAGGWSMPWRSRRRPVFEGQWGCSGRCVLAMARAAVRRELGDGVVAAPHRHRVPLGLVMLAQGWITQAQLRRALDAQRANGTGRIGEWLIAECGVDAEQVTRGLSVQWNCPVLTTEGFSPEAMARVMPRLFVEEFGLLPLRVAGSKILYLGVEDRLDASVALAVEQMTELQVVSGLVAAPQLEVARSRLMESEAVSVRQELLSDADTLAAKITAILEQKQPVESRFVRVHGYYWLRLWMERGTLGRFGSLPATGADMWDYIFTLGGRG